MASKYKIEKGSVDNVPLGELIAFGRQEYINTFGHLFSETQLNEYLSEAYSQSTHNHWLSSDAYCFYIAYNEAGAICGYILCSSTCSLDVPSSEGDSTPQGGEIKRLYIASSTFGSGLSELLLKQGIEWLVQKQLSRHIYLGVYSENPRALKFYERYGFRPVGEYPFPLISVRMFIMHWKGYP